MTSDKKIVIFKIGDEELACEISEVERILGFTEPVKIPQAPEFIVGVINYGDSILPVMDLKKRFNIGKTELKSDPKIIAVRYEKCKVGFIVDQVTEVADISKDKIENAPDIVKGITNEYVDGIIKLGSRIIVLINMKMILSGNETDELKSCVK